MSGQEEEDVYGPILPPKINKEETESSLEESCEKTVVEDEAFGPALPPNLHKSKSSENVQIGPFIPPHLREKLQNQNLEDNAVYEISEEEETFGPVLPGQETRTKGLLALEERALEMKLNQLNPQELKVQREEWMTELPTVSASKLGLGPRQFRPNAGPDMADRSAWTDIAGNEKKKKAEAVNLKEEMEKSSLKKRDKEQEKMAKAHKRSTESLVELHQKKRKEEKSALPKERKPFNRETDLQVNRFDEAQKAAVLKKAQLLDDRFSQGKTKFL